MNPFKFILSLFLVTLCIDPCFAGDRKGGPKRVKIDRLNPPILNATNSFAVATERKVTVAEPDGTNIVETYEVVFHYSKEALIDEKSGKVPVWYVATTSEFKGAEQDGQILWCAKEDQPYEVDWATYSRVMYPRHIPVPLPPQEYFMGYGDGWHAPMSQPVRFAGGASWNHNPYNHAPYWRSYSPLRSHYEVGAWGRTGSIRGTSGGVNGSYRAEYKSPTYASR